MKEIWKDIPDYVGLYQVSNLGKIKSFRQGHKHHKQKEYLLNPTISSSGYYQVTLYSDKGRKKFLVHRLVAVAFLDNPHNYPQINHKDENRLNNRVDNLEWCTASYNNNYGTAKVRIADARSRRVQQLTLDGMVIAIYRSANIASLLLGIEKHNISNACRKGVATNGYYWRYCPSCLLQ